jgi:hypothetical protein
VFPSFLKVRQLDHSLFHDLHHPQIRIRFSPVFTPSTPRLSKSIVVPLFGGTVSDTVGTAGTVGTTFPHSSILLICETSANNEDRRLVRICDQV